MKRLTILFLVLVLVACGGKDNGQVKEPDPDTTDEVEEVVEEPQEVEEIVKYIESDEEEYDWPEASAEEDFVIDKDSGIITEYKGDYGVVVIPSTIDGVQVKHLGEELFNDTMDLTHLYIPDGVETLMQDSVNSCYNLVKLRLPDTLEVIGPMALWGAVNLEEITFPASLIHLDYAALSNLQELKKVSFLGEFPAINSYCFDDWRFDEIVFRVADEEKKYFEDLYEIEVTTDGACNYLDDLVKDDEIKVEDGVLLEYTGDARSISLPEGITKIGEYPFEGREKLTRIKLPDSLVEIGDNGLAGGFEGHSVVQVKFNEGLKKIGDRALSGCHLTELWLPESVESLGEWCFPNLNTYALRIPNKIKTLPKNCFTNAQIYKIYFPDTLEEIGEEALGNVSRLSYMIFEGYKPPKIHKTAFQRSQVDDIDIPWDASKAQAKVFTEIFEKQELRDGEEEGFTVWRANPPHQPPYPSDNSEFVFDEDEAIMLSLKTDDEEITMYWNVWSSEIEDMLIPIMGIGDGIFEKSKIKSFYVPHSNEFRTIGERAFAESQLEEIYLFDSMEAIYDEAFKNCKNLKEVTIPDGLRYIGKDAFAGCENLESLDFKGKDVTILAGAFKGCDKLGQVKLPRGVVFDGDPGLDPEKLVFDDKTTDEELAAYSKELDFPWYSQARRESDPATFVTMPDTDYISSEFFDFDKSTGTITKYNHVYLDEKDYHKRIVIPREIDGVKVEAIGESAFFHMPLESGHVLEEVVLPETIKEIGVHAFNMCESLKKITCYGPLDIIGNRAFENAISLKEANFVNGVKELDIYAFHMCEALESFDLPHLKEIPEGAFSRSGLKGELKLDYESLGNISFMNCTDIEKLILGKKVKFVDEAAFSGCTGLKEVVIEDLDGLVFEGLSHFHDVSKANFILPKGTTEDQKEAFINKLGASGIYNGEDLVKIAN